MDTSTEHLVSKLVLAKCRPKQWATKTATSTDIRLIARADSQVYNSYNSPKLLLRVISVLLRRKKNGHEHGAFSVKISAGVVQVKTVGNKNGSRSNDACELLK